MLASLASAQGLPDPEVYAVMPDRPAPGDEVELVGRNLTFPGCTVKVRFSPGVEVDPSSASETSVRAVVPQQARNGEVQVLRTCGDRTLSSNPLPILVIWREYLPDPASFPQGFSLVGNWPRPGGIVVSSAADNWQFYTDGTPLPSYYLFTLAVDGPAAPPVPFAELYTGWSRSVQPKGWTALGDRGVWLSYSFTYGAAIFDSKFGVLLAAVPYYADCPGTLAVAAVGLDRNGNLLVGAAQYCSSRPYQLAVWRFPPGVPVVLDVNSEYCETPGGVEAPPFGWLLKRIFTDAEDRVLWEFAEWVGGSRGWYEPRLLVAKRGQPPQIWPLPFGEPDEPCERAYGNGFLWNLAVDCAGRLLGVPANISSECWSHPPYWPRWSGKVWELPEGRLVASVNDPWTQLPYPEPRGLAVDVWGNIYLGVAARGQSGEFLGQKIRRVMPEEMVSSCPVGLPLAAGAFAASAWCECVEEKLFLKATLWPEDPESQVLWSREGETLELPLGTAPKLEVLVCEDANRNCRDVEAVRRWELFAPWVQPVAEQAVFPQRPAFFYGADLDTVSESRSALLQTVHLGEQSLAVKVQVNESGGSREVSRQFFLKVVEPSRLGRTNNTYDPHIVYTAHAYGIPPQVIKAQVEQESQFNERSYRYEARTQDYEGFEIQKFFTGRNRAYNALRPFAITPDPRCTSTDCGICKDVPSSPELWEFRAIEYPFFPGGISAGIATPGSAGALPFGTSTSPCGKWWRATTAGYPAPRPGTSATAGYRTWKKFASKRSLNRPMRFLASRQGRAGSDNAGGADGRAAIAPGTPWTA